MKLLFFFWSGTAAAAAAAAAAAWTHLIICFDYLYTSNHYPTTPILNIHSDWFSYLAVAVQINQLRQLMIGAFAVSEIITVASQTDDPDKYAAVALQLPCFALNSSASSLPADFLFLEEAVALEVAAAANLFSYSFL